MTRPWKPVKLASPHSHIELQGRRYSVPFQVLAAASLRRTARSGSGTRGLAAAVVVATRRLAALNLRALGGFALRSLAAAVSTAVVAARVAAGLLVAAGRLAAFHLLALGGFALRSLAAAVSAAVVATVVAAGLGGTAAGSGSSRGAAAGSSGGRSTAARGSVAAGGCWGTAARRSATGGLAAATTEPEGVRVRAGSQDQSSGSQRHPFHVSVLLRQVSLRRTVQFPLNKLGTGRQDR